MTRLKENPRFVLKVPREPYETYWTAAEDALVRKHYRTFDSTKMELLLARLKRSRRAIRIRAQKLGVARKATGKRWTEAELMVVRQPVSHLEAAKTLGRSKTAISRKRWRLKLAKADGAEKCRVK
jgi:hypothetical protein